MADASINFDALSYNSMRDDLVIRIKQRLTEESVAVLNEEFKGLVKKGTITQRDAYKEESDHLELPRIAFTHTRRQFALVRTLIDRINELPTEG